MPLVQRTSKQGNFFKKDAEPTDWMDADLWADTDASPRTLYINNAGTALALGAFSLGDSDVDQTAEGTDVGAVIRRLATTTTGFVTQASVTVTPTKIPNLVVIVGAVSFGVEGASKTATIEIEESGSEVGSSSKARVSAALSSFNIQTAAILTDVSIAAHTYDVTAKGNDTTSEIYGGAVSAFVLE